MKLKTTTNITVDGVMQGLGGAEEDRRDGFDRGGWAIPLVDTEMAEYLDEVYASAAAFLFGRRTYEIFARSWGAFADPGTSAIAAALNGRPKYVVSNTVADPKWSGTTVLNGDIASAIRKLKSQDGGTLLVPGSGELVRWLLAGDMIDEIELVTYPVIVGQGRRLFPDAGPDLALELISTRTTSGGSTIQTYRPAGRPQYQQATLDTNEMSTVGRARRSS